ncbi:MAG: FKBP-type peptidyl-prolyl cis-trans isomerase [Bdellovibrionaceae bacterium]|nr:FKBP-type peptidyl-prolyl cis-trans isomerase [Pseudobdellovibrionaceae bacterium]
MRLKAVAIVASLVTVIAIIVFLFRGPAAKPVATNDFSYTLGHQYGRNLVIQGIQPKEIDMRSFLEGAKDVLQGQAAKLSAEQMQQALQSWQRTRDEQTALVVQANQSAGTKFRSDYARQEGVQSTPSGLLYRVLKTGAGPRPKATDLVRVHYSGKLVDGTEFDSSYSRTKPDDLPLRSVIAGWTEALTLVPAGSKVQIVVPPELGYGTQNHPKIPPGSTLIYDIELLAVL